MTDPEVIRAWFTAHLDEDERVARAVPGSGRWSAYLEGGDDGWAIEDADKGDPSFIVGYPTLAEHIARHNPARTSREVEAKRRRMERHAPMVMADTVTCLVCRAWTGDWPCEELMDDAQSWADDPTMPEELKLT